MDSVLGQTWKRSWSCQSTSNCSASKSSVGSGLQILITAASKLPLLSIPPRTRGECPPTRRQQLSRRRPNTLTICQTGSPPVDLFLFSFLWKLYPDRKDGSDAEPENNPASPGLTVSSNKGFGLPDFGFSLCIESAWSCWGACWQMCQICFELTEFFKPVSDEC